MKRLPNRLSAVGLTLLATLACPSLHAQSPSTSSEGFPSKPMRWIVPFPPGGPVDMVARIVGQRLSERMRQPVLVENRAGAFGSIGAETAVRATPDGYTVILFGPSLVINAILYKLSFDPLTELTAVSQLVTFTLVLIANPHFPPRTVEEVLAAANARPGTVTCGFGTGLPQLGCALLKLQGQVSISAVPYKGQAPVMNDLVGGQINLTFEVTNATIPQVKANRVRAIATANPKRGMGPFGHLPTVSETLPGFELVGWFGVFAPAATPSAIITRLNGEIAAVLEEDDVRKRLTDGGLEIAPGLPKDLAQIMRRDYTRYSKIIREAGIKAE